MSATEIESHIRNDTVWQRPAWPLGTFGMQRFRQEPEADVFEARPSRGAPAPETPEVWAMRAMKLHHPVTRAKVKARYKELVKRFHPDNHGGDRTTEEKLRVIIDAYKTLMNCLNA